MNTNQQPRNAVSRTMILAIARELALINGRSTQDVSKFRWEREQILQAQQSRRAEIPANLSLF